MTSCEHINWLRASGRQDITLHNEGRLPRLLTELDDPQRQQPSLLLFVGHRTKNIALRELFPYNNIKRGRQDGLTNLRLDTSTIHSTYPIFFADSNPDSQPALHASSTLCHEVRSYTFSSRNSPNATIFDMVHARLLCQFSDVICIFAEDFENLDSVVERLESWASMASISPLAHQTRPRVIIVVKGDDASPTYNVLQAEDLRFNLHKQDLISFFSSITVLRLADTQISPLARYRRLKEVLLRHADEVRQLRHSLRSLYSASHLNRFFAEAVKDAAEGLPTPRSFLFISRQHNQITADFCEHLLNFFKTCKGSVDNASTLSIIASSIVMDAYPPGMHGNLDPIELRSLTNRLQRSIQAWCTI